MSDVGGLLPRAFFARPAHLVAPELLGRVLVRRDPDGEIALRITEVEAYESATDPAAHGYRGPTPRTASMFGPPGHLYVYWIYGMHHAANLICGLTGDAQGVLIRAGEIIRGQSPATGRRPNARGPHELAKGPGRLALALDLDRTLDGLDVCAAEGAVTAHQGTPCPAGAIRSGPRTGVSQGHETPWRFWIDGDPTVSPYRRHVPRKRARS